MADDALNPALRQIAEQYLNRPLEAEEEAQLLKLQQGFQGRSPAGGARNVVDDARRQAQLAMTQGQAQATSGMRGILESIQASSTQALEVQEKEEQAIVQLLESCKTLSDLRPASLNPGLSGLQPGNQLALTQIAGHLANLAKQEVENCFNQQFGPLITQLKELIQRLNDEDAAKVAEDAARAATQVAAPAQEATPAQAVAPAQAATPAQATPATPAASAQAPDVHDASGQASMQ